MGPLSIGIDIGGTHLRAARVKPDGTIVSRAAAPSTSDAPSVLARCLDLIGEVGSPEASSIGIGVPGQVNAATGQILSGGYVDLSGLNLAELVGTETGLPVTVENDAGMALLGEAVFGAARFHRNVVMLTIGTGIGGAILEQGKLLRGRGAAGQLGHIKVEPDGRLCLCGSKGCLETVSSGTAFGRHLAEAGLPTGTKIEDLLALSGDPAAARLLAAWASPLQQALDSLMAICNPDLVVLGGGMGAAAVAALERLPRPLSWFAAPLVAASLGTDAGIVGAAHAARAGLQKDRRVILVNGVPASGKSGVAKALGHATGWPVLALDQIKEPFLSELPPGDRAWNRRLGMASYAAIFALLKDAPQGMPTIIDAWFGFQPPEVLKTGLESAGVTDSLELWCSAPPETVAARYRARIGQRPAGHPGAEYASELMELAGHARPISGAPVFRIDTTTPLDLAGLLEWLDRQWPSAR